MATKTVARKKLPKAKKTYPTRPKTAKTKIPKVSKAMLIELFGDDYGFGACDDRLAAFRNSKATTVRQLIMACNKEQDGLRTSDLAWALGHLNVPKTVYNKIARENGYKIQNTCAMGIACSICNPEFHKLLGKKPSILAGILEPLLLKAHARMVKERDRKTVAA